MNQNLCALLTDDVAARRFVSAVADWADFRHDARHMCSNVVTDPGKKIRDTLPSGARFDIPESPSEQSVLKQTALIGDPNKVFLMVIGILFSSAEIRDIVIKSTPRMVANAYFSDFHARVEAALVGTEEAGILPHAVLVARERIRILAHPLI